MADIFISYSSQEKERIKHLAEMLSKIGGWSVWWDREIPIGKSFDVVIGEELNNARCVLVVWSSQSIKSDWVIEEAQEGRKRNLLIPVLIDNVLIPFGFRRIQAANLTAWDGSEADTQFKKLINDITSILRYEQEPFHSIVEMQGTLPLQLASEAKSNEVNDPVLVAPQQPTSTPKPSNQQKIKVTRTWVMNQLYRKYLKYPFLVGLLIFISFIAIFEMTVSSDIYLAIFGGDNVRFFYGGLVGVCYGFGVIYSFNKKARSQT